MVSQLSTITVVRDDALQEQNTTDLDETKLIKNERPLSIAVSRMLWHEVYAPAMGQIVGLVSRDLHLSHLILKKEKSKAFLGKNKH